MQNNLSLYTPYKDQHAHKSTILRVKVLTLCRQAHKPKVNSKINMINSLITEAIHSDSNIKAVINELCSVVL